VTDIRHLAAGLALALLAVASARAATFHTIDDKTIEGDLADVDARGVMTVNAAGGQPVKLPADELMRVDFTADREPDELIDGVVAYLPGGDRVNGTLVRSSPTGVELQSRSLRKLTLKIESLLAIEFRRAGEQPKDAAKLRARMLANTGKNDVSFSATGDQMPGILVGFDGKSVRLKTALGEMPFQCSRLFGLSFAARARRPEPPELLAVVRCVDGSLVTGRLRATDTGGIRLALLAGPELDIPARQIIDVGFKNGKLVYLSDLKPVKAGYRPYFSGDHTWPYRPDQTYDRKPIRLAGKAHRKGLGTFSGMTLTYALGGAFSKFAALVGIDDADVNHQGDVTVRVLADGKEAFKKAGLTRKTGPVRVALPMKGVKTLTLVVEFGGNMHFGDLTDWANAHLIR